MAIKVIKGKGPSHGYDAISRIT